MSVILDALRRARGVGDRPTAAAPRPRTIPAGLGLGPGPAAPQRQRTPWVLWAGAATIVVLGVWAVVRLTPRGGESGPIAASSPVAQPVTPQANAAPGPPVMPAPASVESVEPSSVPRVRRPPLKTPSPARAESRKSSAPSLEPSVDHFHLAVRYQSLGDFEQALKHYLAVLAEDELNIEARNNLGLLYHGRGLTEDAIDQFRRAILINPRYTKARSNLAVVLTSAGRLAEARAELRTALALEPRNADLVVNMALLEKADQHPGQAIEWLLRAVGDRPDHAAAHYNLAVLYEERGSLALAYHHYSAFLKHAGPEHVALLGAVQQRAELLETASGRARP